MNVKAKTIVFDDKDININAISLMLWTKGDDQPNQTRNKTTVIIDSHIQYQEFNGIGAAFSELGSRALSKLGCEKKDEVMRKLFSPHEGIGLSYCRIPLGSSDFALDAYSLNDYEDDYKMEHFCLERDLKLLIPMIKKAQEYNENIRFHASPWSPPSWLKDNKKFVSGGSLLDNDKAYDAYAKYLGLFCHQYEEQGIEIERLNIQNEPDSSAPFPSCVMKPCQMNKFVNEYLVKYFKDNNIKTEIWAGTFRTITGLQAQRTLEKKKLRDNIQGVGVQYSLDNHVSDLLRLYPELKIMHTESVCYNGENTYEQAINLFLDFIGYMNVGCDVYSYWNMILTAGEESTWGWKQNSLVSITEDGNYTCNNDFDMLQVINFNLQVGARRIGVVCLKANCIAFKNPDGTIALLIGNISNKILDTEIIVDGIIKNVELNPFSVSSFLLE